MYFRQSLNFLKYFLANKNNQSSSLDEIELDDTNSNKHEDHNLKLTSIIGYSDYHYKSFVRHN